MIAPASTASAKRQQELEPEWLAALADAQVADDDAALYILAGEASNVGRGAAYLSPTVHLVDPSDQELAAEPRGVFEDLRSRAGQHRVVVWAGGELGVAAAKLRHELEHARQWTAHGERLFTLTAGIQGALQREKLNGLAGGAVQSVAPAESDANAAAAQFARPRYPALAHRLIEGRADDAGLFRSHSGPEPLDSLPQRIIAHAFLYRSLCERCAERDGTPFRDWLERTWPGARAFWDALCGASLPTMSVRGRAPGAP